MVHNLQQQFVRTVLLVAALVILAVALQGAVLLHQGADAGSDPYTQALVLPNMETMHGVSIADQCQPSNNGGGGC
ncbi:MAG: hypothetical protein KJ063_06775 [Anaerolineae bacterium]|nr:hypothetical protein [Anaerolineae bacterium]